MNIVNLKNSLEVNLISEEKSSTSIICFVAKTGKAVEYDYFKMGINAIVEKLIFSGTDKYPTARHLAIYLESLGANVHTNVNFETFQIYIEVPYYNVNKAISLLADVIQNSHYEQGDIDIAKKMVQEMYFSNQENTGVRDGAGFIERFFYFNDVDKADRFLTLENLMNITRDDVVYYILQQFQPEQSKLFVIGSINSESQLHDLIEQEWADWNTKIKKYIDPTELKDPNFPIDLPVVNYRQRGSFLAELSLGFIVDNQPQSRFLDPETGEYLPSKNLQKIIQEFIRDYAIIVLFNQVLGVGLASRLWMKSVEEDMLFHSVESEFTSLKSLQYLGIKGIAENSQFIFAFESLLAGLESLKRSTISMHEISRNKEILKAKLTLMNDNKIFKAIWIIENYLATGIVLNIEQFIDVIVKIQAHELRSLALDAFNSDRMVIYISGTAKEKIIIDKMINKYL